MRLLLYGATGTLGQRILAEALDRGHEVTTAARNPARIQELPGVTLRQGDVLDTDSVARLSRGQEVLLSGCRMSPIDNRGGSTATVAIAHDTPERIVIEASTDHAGYLVVTDTWFPGWSARVNGRPATIERANHAFRSVKLEPGQHEIELRYEPASVQIGLVVSLLALGVTSTLGWRRGWRRRQSGERP